MVLGPACSFTCDRLNLGSKSAGVDEQTANSLGAVSMVTESERKSAPGVVGADAVAGRRGVAAGHDVAAQHADGARCPRAQDEPAGQEVIRHLVWLRQGEFSCFSELLGVSLPDHFVAVIPPAFFCTFVFVSKDPPVGQYKVQQLCPCRVGRVRTNRIS